VYKKIRRKITIQEEHPIDLHHEKVMLIGRNVKPQKSRLQY